MATNTQRSNESLSKREDLSAGEEVDIAIAIAASLETPQVLATHIHQSSSEWSPKTIEEWEVYNRQKSAMTVADQYSKSLGHSHGRNKPSQYSQ